MPTLPADSGPRRRLPAPRGLRLPPLIVAVQAPGPRNLGLAIHPDLPDDALPLLQPLRALQLLRRGEHVLVQSPFKAAVSSDRDVRRRVRAAILAVAAVAAALSVLQELLPGTLPAVRVARDPHHQGSQGEHQPDAHARDKVQSCSLGIFCRRRKKRHLRDDDSRCGEHPGLPAPCTALITPQSSDGYKYCLPMGQTV